MTSVPSSPPVPAPSHSPPPAPVSTPAGTAPSQSDSSAGRFFRLLVGITSLAVALSAIIIAIAASFMAKPAILPLAGFELVALAAGVTGLFWSRGRFADGPSLALLCIGACIGVASILGYVGATGKIELPNKPPLSLRPWLGGRLLASALYIAIAAHLTLRQGRRSYSTFLKSIAAFAPFLCLLAVMFLAWARIDAALASIHTFARVSIFAVLGIISAVSICAGGHLMIRAFESASEPDQPTDEAQAQASDPGRTQPPQPPGPATATSSTSP